MTRNDVTSDDATLTCHNIVHGYRAGAIDVPVLHNISLTVRPGTFTAIAGPSGSGKSTLLRLIACLELPDHGSIRLGNTDVSRLSPRKQAHVRRRAIGFVRQAPAENLISYLTIRQHLQLAARMRGARANDDVLSRLGLDAHHNRLPRHLSGGEQQRAAIAFAATGSPHLLVADEPTGQLDHTHVEAVVTALRNVADTGVSVVAATHDPYVWNQADTVLRLHDGHVADEPA